MQDDELLRPTLSEQGSLKPIYSVGALIASAFFGGMAAVCIVGGENARRQRRLGKDAIWLALAILATIGLLYGVMQYQVTSGEGVDASMVRLANRGGGFALAGLFYWLHRTAYRTQQFTGTDAPSPWAIVITACVIGIILVLGLGLLFQRFIVAGSP